MNSAVRVKKVSKKYGNFTALQDIDLEVKAGTMFALLGPNGAGKTTLMRILTTQIKPTEGNAFVFDKDVEHQSTEVRNMVSYVPQEMSVWPDISGYENLLVYSKIYNIAQKDREQTIREALEIMELAPFAHKLVSTYSGGMIRKLELACAIMINPKILFLDEPTIGLDPSTRKTVWEKISQLVRERGTTVFFTTHYMDEAETFAEKIGIINKGKLVKVATPSELIESVGDDMINIELEKPLNDKAIDSIRKMDKVSNVETDQNMLTVRTRDSSSCLEAVISQITKTDNKILRIWTSKPNIEDVFLKYAGGNRHSIYENMTNIDDLKKTRDRIRRG